MLRQVICRLDTSLGTIHPKLPVEMFSMVLLSHFSALLAFCHCCHLALISSYRLADTQPVIFPDGIQAVNCGLII
jgi:hypothetical protein